MSGSKGPSDKTQIMGGSEPRKIANTDDLGTAILKQKSDKPIAKLTVLSDPGKGQVRNVHAGANSVGRDGSNQVQLDIGDPTISRTQHVLITADARTGEFKLYDNGKSNPIFINGAMVDGERPIKAGDIIKIGNTQLRLDRA